MKKRRILVTAGLPYSNGNIHVGHIAGAYLPGDIYVRYLRLCGHEVKWVCGSDDHGVTIMLAAEKEGKTPYEVAQYYRKRQHADFEGLGIHFDVYGSTSENPFHKKASQDFFMSMYDKGYFEKIESKQFFDNDKKRFLPDRYIIGTCGFCGTKDQNGDQCENCGKMLDVESLKEARTRTGGAVEVKETKHWFLDLSKAEKAVDEWLDKAVLRDHTRAYVKSLLSAGLVKRSMTRDIDWGIPVPLPDPDAKGKVLYVWFDAPIGYISNTMEMCEKEGKGSAAFTDYWKSKDSEIYHFIGEDNTIFHCLIWIAMLSAEGSFELPTGVFVNQFLNIQFPGKDVEKVSKSRGSAVWISDYIAEGMSTDVLRYYLTSIAPERARTVYNPEDLIQKNNSELGNTLGNFVNRIISFTHKHFGPKIPDVVASKVIETDTNFIETLKNAHLKIGAEIEAGQFKDALMVVMDFARDCNKYVDDRAPWTLRKTDMEATGVALTHSIWAIHFLGVVLAPFMPGISKSILGIFGKSDGPKSWNEALEFPSSGTELGTCDILFKKIE
jgi:methionyl-tRNA synthetase